MSEYRPHLTWAQQRDAAAAGYAEDYAQRHYAAAAAKAADDPTRPLERGPGAGEHVALLQDTPLPQSQILVDKTKGLTSDWVFFE